VVFLVPIANVELKPIFHVTRICFQCSRPNVFINITSRWSKDPPDRLLYNLQKISCCVATKQTTSNGLNFLPEEPNVTVECLVLLLEIREAESSSHCHVKDGRLYIHISILVAVVDRCNRKLDSHVFMNIFYTSFLGNPSTQSSETDWYVEGKAKVSCL
jgi:hypothetical protein